jgi:hypothetical protein
MTWTFTFQYLPIRLVHNSLQKSCFMFLNDSTSRTELRFYCCSCSSWALLEPRFVQYVRCVSLSLQDMMNRQFVLHSLRDTGLQTLTLYVRLCMCRVIEGGLEFASLPGVK